MGVLTIMLPSFAQLFQLVDEVILDATRDGDVELLRKLSQVMDRSGAARSE